MPEVERSTMNGQKHTGIEVEFEPVKNDWSDYRLKGATVQED